MRGGSREGREEGEGVGRREGGGTEEGRRGGREGEGNNGLPWKRGNRKLTCQSWAVSQGATETN